MIPKRFRIEVGTDFLCDIGDVEDADSSEDGKGGEDEVLHEEFNDPGSDGVEPAREIRSVSSNSAKPLRSRIILH